MLPRTQTNTKEIKTIFPKNIKGYKFLPKNKTQTDYFLYI